ncbi:hypothetical protein ACFXOR_18895 [Streptomyces sp. NPDC059164]
MALVELLVVLGLFAVAIVGVWTVAPAPW